MKSFLVIVCLFSLLACVHSQTIYDYLHTDGEYGFYVERLSTDQNFESLLQNKSVNITVIAWKDTAHDVWSNLTLQGMQYATFLTRQESFQNETLYETAFQTPELLGANQRILVTQAEGNLVYFNHFNNFHLNISSHLSLDNGVLYEMADNIFPVPTPPFLNFTLANDPQFSKFWALIQKFPNVLDTVVRSQVTLLAPNNYAFMNPLIDEYLLNAEHDQAQAILLNHFIFNKVIYSDMISTNGIPYQVESPSALINITRYPATATVTTKTSRAIVDEFDLLGENGVIISIDEFIFPDNFYFTMGSVLSALPEVRAFYNLTQDPSAKNFNSLISQSVNANMTLFAPDNAAFQNMSLGLNQTLTLLNQTLLNFLYYHILPHSGLNSQAILQNRNPHQLYTTGLYEPGIAGYQYINVQVGVNEKNRSTIQINDGKIVEYDLQASNGFIQVLDTVLTPPYSMSHILQDIHDPDRDVFYGTTVDLLSNTDIAQTLLKTGRNLTFLIPANSAWNYLTNSGITEYISNNINLTSYILREHILVNALLYTNNLPSVETVYKNLNGNNVTVRYNSSQHQVYVNQATMIGPLVNILYSNGVGQLISQVLIPHDVVFTTENVLSGLGYNSFLLAIHKTGYAQYLNRTNVTFLAANDTEWAKHINDPADELRQTVQLNIIPQTVTSIVSETGKVSYPTLLDGYRVEFIQGGQQAHLLTPTGTVLDPVQVSSSGPQVVHNGAVIGVSGVFSFTYEQRKSGGGLGAGMIVLIVFLVVFGVAALGVAGFFGYRYYQKRGQYKIIN